MLYRYISTSMPYTEESEDFPYPPTTEDFIREEVETFDQRKSKRKSKRGTAKRTTKKSKALKDGYKKYHAYNSTNKRIAGEFVNRSPAGAARKAANRETKAKGRMCKKVSVVQQSRGVNEGKRHSYTVHTKKVPASNWAISKGISQEGDTVLQTTVKAIRS